MAKNKGKQFETDWKDSYKQTPFFYLRLVDAVKWQQGEGSTFTPSNPYDSLQYAKGHLWCLELKSTEQASMSFNSIVHDDTGFVSAPWLKPKHENTQVMLKANQVKALMETDKNYGTHGVICGFILNFRARILKTKSEPNETFFVHINDFITYANLSLASSISREKARSIGVAITGTQKKIHYKYDIEQFIDDTLQHFKTKIKE